MINYNSKEWLRFIINFPKADTVRKLLPLLFSMAVYSSVIAYLIIDFWKLSDGSDLRNISLMHSLLGFVISMLLVFRTNTAYDRWWEGRKQWGSLVNTSRNLAIRISRLVPADQPETLEFFQVMIPNFAFALKNHLRSRPTEKEFEECAQFRWSDIHAKEHVPNQISTALFGKVGDLQSQRTLLPEQQLLLDTQLQALMDICGACERIHKTPIPFSYSSFLKKFIFTYCVTLPLGYVFSLHYLVIPFAVFVFYVLASLEIIAEEIEDPFGTDENDLPIDDICQTIRQTVVQTIRVAAPAATR